MIIRWDAILIAMCCSVWLHTLGAAVAFRFGEAQLAVFCIIGAVGSFIMCCVAGTNYAESVKVDEAQSAARRLANELEHKEWALVDMRRAAETSEAAVKRLEAELRAHGVSRVQAELPPDC